MTSRPTISFSKFALPKAGSVVVLMPDDKKLSPAAEKADPGGILERAARITDFTGKFATALDLIAPAGSDFDRLIVIGTGKSSKLEEGAWHKLGGTIFAQAKKATAVTVIAELAGVQISDTDAADLALGILLRAYEFDKYKTRKDDKDKKERKADKPVKVTIQCADPAAAKKAFARALAIADGVMLARDLVNEPANILGPIEFADKAAELEKLGVEIEILTEKELRKLGMGAYLGVAQGSVRPPRLVVMQWKGGKAKDQPVAFIGKGVVFDTGGISIKPAASMEDMKGDMGGAAAVTGLMHTLAARKAKANVIGILGLVENMPDAAAQRPGDIVTSMSGQTIEIINTDAEGRLILADMLWYCNDRFKPRFMINLATLTGAILVALGNQHAGLFSNDDVLSEQLSDAGEATGEKVWRMPMASEYDKLIDSKNADMKNVGGRNAGSITAAQFLKRFVKETPWAHLDIAGTAMGSPSTEINQSWASGYGVRLLDRLMADNYED